MKIKRTVLVGPGGTELVYTTEDGAYLGRARFECLDANVLELIAKDAVNFAAEQLASHPEIALAVASSLRGN
jgi:hypothetical protein